MPNGVERIPRSCLHRVANERQERTRGGGDAKGRPLRHDYHFVGLVGEEEFGYRFGLETDLSWRPGGDNGIDFTLPDGTTVDVKTNATNTRASERCLLREANKRHARILVLARYHDDETATLLGWQYDDIVTQAAPVVWPRTIRNHVIPATSLRPMEELEQLCGLVACDTAAPLTQAGFAEWESFGDDRWTR